MTPPSRGPTKPLPQPQGPEWPPISPRLWRHDGVGTREVLIAVAVLVRCTAAARVGRRATWNQDRELLDRHEQQRSVTIVDSAGAPVRVLRRHRKRLPQFLIEIIVNLSLGEYQLSDSEDKAVRQALLDVTPNRNGDVRVLARHLAALVRFANRATTWDPLKPAELLSPEHLPQFMAAYKEEISDAMYNEARTVLIRAGGQLHKNEPFRDVPAGRRVEWRQPTDEDQIERMWLAARAHSDAHIRSLLLLFIALCRGAGLRTSDLKVVHGHDIVHRSVGRTAVVIQDGEHRREVIILRRYGRLARQLAAPYGPELVFADCIEDDGMLDKLRKLTRDWDRDVAFLNPVSLSNAYFLEIAQRRVSIAAICRQMRGHTLRGFEDLRNFMDREALSINDDLEGQEATGIHYFSPTL